MYLRVVYESRCNIRTINKVSTHFYKAFLKIFFVVKKNCNPALNSQGPVHEELLEL